jgi:N-acetylneuraminic acid mutarotase
MPLNQEYDPVTDTWRDRAPMPLGLNHVAVVGLNGKLYACGGFVQQNRGAVPDVYEYDVRLDLWRALAPLLEKRGAAAAVVLGGQVHLV